MKIRNLIFKIKNNRMLRFAIILIFFALLPFFVGNPYYIHILVLVLVYILLALGLNVIICAGLLDLGYIAFYAVGAYSYAILNTRFNFSFWTVMPIAFGLSVVCGVILGLVSLKSRGDYFAIVTLGFGEIVRLILRNSDSLTNGPKGIMGISKPFLFISITKPIHFYFLILLMTVIIFYIVHRLMISRIGAGWIAVRENETWAKTTGYHVLALKLSACVTGAVIAGATGVFFAGWQTFVAPESFIFFESILVLCMVVLGGGIKGNLLGVMIGAAILTVLPELFREFNQYRMLAFGMGMTCIVVLKSEGLVSWDWSKSYYERLFEQKHYVQRPLMKWMNKLLDSLVSHDRKLLKYTGNPQGLNAEDIILSVKELRKYYGGTKALDGFTFEFEKGKVYGIMGFNAAGKTTLFNCLRGLVTPDSGEVEVFGETFFSKRKRISVPAHLLAKYISTTFQICQLIESMPAWKNVYWAVQPLRTGKDIWREIIFSLVGGFHGSEIKAKDKTVSVLKNTLGFTEEELKTPVSELSFGTHRKVELAKALVMETPIILLDEPTSGLNDYEKMRFIEIIKRIKSDKTIVIIEHNYRMLEEISDEVLFFKEGNIAIDDEERPIVGPYQYVVNNETVERDYIGVYEALSKGIKTLPAPIALEINIEKAGYQSGATVLRGLNLNITQGSITVIHGRNGSGKSTLLKCIMNSDELAFIEGSLLLKRQLEKDLNLLKLKSHEIARMAISLVPQGKNLFDTMSVDENLRYATFYRNDLQSDIETDISYFYNNIFYRTFFPDREPLDEKHVIHEMRKIKSRQAQHLSGGQKQMVAIGRALVATPLITGKGTEHQNNRILLLDEPTAGLQPSLVNIVIDTIDEINRNFGYTIIIVEQNTEVDRIAHESYKIVAGKLELR